MNRIPRGALVNATAAVAMAASLAVPGLVRPAFAAPAGCDGPAQPGAVIRETPWQQKWLAPERVWPFSTGRGVRVAVIDSGSDKQHPQLQGQVLTGFDALRNTAGGDVDCVSHGTAVASIIAARREEGIGFAGLAPDAKILPVRISERNVDAGGASDDGETVTAAKLGQAIRWAVDNGADVINLSLVVYTSDPALESAVAYAREKDVVLVAAVGNQHRQDGQPDPVPYPAALEGVIGVGAIDELGVRVGQSQVGPYVDLVAPGGAVVAATRGFGHNVWSGTSFATPMVSATAALIRANDPNLSAESVARRLLATTDPARGGTPSQAYGRGVVAPYRAVTERLTAVPPVAQAPMPDRPHDPVAEARAARWRDLSQLATILALGAGVLTAIVVGVAYVLPRGRRRRWSPTRAAPPVQQPELDIDDPEQVFYRVPTGSALTNRR